MRIYDLEHTVEYAFCCSRPIENSTREMCRPSKIIWGTTDDTYDFPSGPTESAYALSDAENVHVPCLAARQGSRYVQSREVDVPRWKGAELIESYAQWRYGHSDTSKEFNLLEHSFIITKVLQTLPELRVAQTQTEPKLVPRSEASALTSDEEKRQREQNQSELISKLYCRRCITMWSPIFRCWGGKSSLIHQFSSSFRAIS